MEIIKGLIVLIVLYETIRFIVVSIVELIKDVVNEHKMDKWYEEDGK